MRKSAKIFLFSFLFACMSLFSLVPMGNGSVDFKRNIIPILKTKPEFGNYILQSFKFYGDPMGNRMGESFSPILSGGRIGPYDLEVSWRSGSVEVFFVLVINTRIYFYGNDGNEIKDGNYIKSTKYFEVLDSIEIFPAEGEFMGRKTGGQVYSTDLLK